MYANACAQAGYNELANVWQELAQVRLQFQRVVLANSVAYADFDGSFGCSFRDGPGKSLDAIILAKHETA